jgi:hypothetical protein
MMLFHSWGSFWKEKGMIETHKSATSLAMIFDFVLHFFDFTVDVCHLYGEAASASGSALVLGRAETSR